MRLIDADKLKAHYAWWKGGTREMTMDEAKNDFDTIIDLQPTVEPTKHGRWSRERLPSTDGGSYEVFRCNLCNEAFNWRTAYCPWCGARMDLIGEDKSHPFAESVMMGMDGRENG